ncbi:MAG: helix-turn-helix domain-containing protein [Verrucomicrobia bacterium]|nr:MAG: helix-turn-helix domain-containing protein [Verrucomicrobiota bacterium]TAE87480.1 MAG: helix-turn-helix domain-containing protein [Verrucomicrobiota bacterium]TAF25762.1 MAG: helix-turn-helix domain-containing protein [Verrucomicrobiota bacterium]TAF41550.1 MAG: helix-turn-helix domain-containing protein [Verrucomicrobiota bacterium]
MSIFVETATSWGRRVVAGILSYAKEHGPWHIQIEPTGPSDEPVIPSGWRGDGVIARVATRSFAQQLEALGVPVVNVSSIKIPGVDHPRVTTNADAVCRMAVDHFTVRGLRHFAYVGNLGQSYIKSQYEAFVAALRARGLECGACCDSGGGEGMAAWLRTLPKPSGVLCWGPRIGRLVIDACLAEGIAVPHDVAVLGADYDELQSEASHPPQSGVRMASEQIGLIAAALLDSRMAGRLLERDHWEISAGGVVAKASSDALAVDDAQMASVMRYVQAKFREPIDMPDILRAVPMSRRSLERKFRQTFGMSVIDRIRQIRVNEARLLLSATNDPITSIAEKCGFASYNYMGRIFQADTGMTPRDYRAQFRARRF